MIEKVNDNMKHRTTRFLFSSVICLSLLGVVIFIWLGSVMAGKSENEVERNVYVGDECPAPEKVRDID